MCFTNIKLQLAQTASYITEMAKENYITISYKNCILFLLEEASTELSRVM